MYRLIFFVFIILCSCSSSTREELTQTELIQEVNSKFSAIRKNPNDKHELIIKKNKAVKKWIRYFTKKDRKRFTRFVSRGLFYKEVIQTMLEEEELPHLLYYLPLIESGFVTKAHSRSGAVGPWQFVKATGKRYGLTINSYIDERRDPILSTEAAAKYLTDLYNVFQSWELAIAAYNCGEMRVLRAIMRGKTRDFWALSRKKLLPRETRNYVPKFMAAAHIAENPRKYKISASNKNNYPDVDAYTIPGGVTLKKIARSIKYPYKYLHKLNPALKKRKTPSWISEYSIWLPPGYGKKLKKIKTTLSYRKKKKRSKHRSGYYRVRRGDSLTKISKRFKVPISKIKRINNLKGNKILIGQRIALKSRHYKRIKGKRFYFVKRSDYLGRIARRFRLSISYLKKLNGLTSDHIYVGQKIDVSRGIRNFHYRVKRGDNLIRIAKLYGTTTRKIRRKNSLKSSHIYIGQVLKI